MGLFDFTQKKAKQPSLQFAPEFPETKYGREWLAKLLKGGVPEIPRLEIPGMTGIEKFGQTLLGEYAQTGMPKGFEEAFAEIMKTIKGGYDPRTSELYKGFRVGSLEEEESAINKLRRGQQLRGAFTGTPGAGMEAKERRRFAGERTQLLGELTEAERNRIMAMIPELFRYGAAEEMVPQARLGAIGQYGGLPRGIETRRAETLYDQLMKTTMFPYTAQSPIATALMSQRPELYMDPGRPAEDKEWWKWTKTGLGILGGMPN